MIYITGDTHGVFQRFDTEYFSPEHPLTRDDHVIICGDFGGIWENSKAERGKLTRLENKPFTTLFIDGNHENFDILNKLPQVEWHGGKVHRVREHVFHLMRGQIFEIDGRRFFTMGGAASHDIADGILDPNMPDFEERYWEMRWMQMQFRVKGRSWWPQEMPNDEEYEEVISNLERVGWQVDCILTHCAPTGIAKQISRFYKTDRLTNFLEMVRQKCRFGYWFFGHYHDNKIIDEKYILQWEQIIQLK